VFTYFCSPMFGHPSCPPLCWFKISIRTFFPVPVCLSEVWRLVSRAGHRFLPSPVRAVTAEVAWLPTAPAHRSSLVSSPWGGGGNRLPQNVLALVFWGLAVRSTASS
jgi:hypothetical protein